MQNSLICDPNEGVCEIPDRSVDAQKIETTSATKPIRLIYFTDPICSSCWGIEPQLRKLKLEYGQYLEIEYRMGGLLPDWSYNSGGISKPSDVAGHWDEVSLHYDMPIDGDVWLEDPLHSSFPPSIAFKAAQMQDKSKALLFLRAMRELVFLHKKNIAKWENLEIAAQNVGLNAEQLKLDYQNKAKSLFEADLDLAKQYGVRGFPTLFFVNETGQKETVYGTRPYSLYETAILKLHPKSKKRAYDKNWETLFSTYNTLTLREFSELSERPRAESEKQLNALVDKGALKVFRSKNGSIWNSI
ncbi:DsbA family protein [Marinilongibacter aquaticus]|uniref:ClpXP adapter SpxH family protein n=1 Tax=Marinilongibacter aquaticus TaxID=2975157 RepID=UPI0021BD2118|nr:ClpXP adapter SpxH family protein [Marinilongibacter aquaticus]UBM59497.1 DsbA family protein [Marinilongibacter aquaticus]